MRKISSAIADKYARDMRSGRWKINGAAIIFDEHGCLVNGRHRLTACATSGCDFFTWVVYGVPVASFETIDTGKSRSFKDELTHNGERYGNLLGAAVGWIGIFEKSGKLDRASISVKVAFSHSELHECLSRHPTVRDHVLKCASYRLSNPSFAVALRYFTHMVNADKCDEFFGRLADGIGLVGGSPIYLLRERLLSSRESAQAKLTLRYESALIIKAWNAFLLGQTVGRLQWAHGKGEQFPDIAGMALDGSR